MILAILLMSLVPMTSTAQKAPDLFIPGGQVLLEIRDANGAPIREASAIPVEATGLEPDRLPGELRFSPFHFTPFTPQPIRSIANGQLLVKAPAPEHGLRIEHVGFEPLTLFEFPSGKDARRTVTLQPATRLIVHASLPSPLPDLARMHVLVQVEASKPALRLFTEDRTTYAEETRKDFGKRSERLFDARSSAPWSFTASLAYSDPIWPLADQDPGTLTLLGIVPGVPMHVRVLEPTGAIFFDADVAALAPGEARELTVNIPDPLAPLSGVVQNADTTPAAGVELYFGSPGLGRMAVTDKSGRFQIQDAYSTEGALLIESATPWLYRSAAALLYEPSFSFPEGEVVVITLPPLEPLAIELARPDGLPVEAPWSVELFDASGAVLMGEAERNSTTKSAAHAGSLNFDFACPGSQELLLVARAPGVVLRKKVALGDTHVRLEIPALAKLTITSPVDKGAAFYRLLPKGGGAPIWVRFHRYGVRHATDVYAPPGTFELQGFRIPDGAIHTVAMCAPQEVTLQTGAAVELEIP